MDCLCDVIGEVTGVRRTDDVTVEVLIEYKEHDDVRCGQLKEGEEYDDVTLAFVIAAPCEGNGWLQDKGDILELLYIG